MWAYELQEFGIDGLRRTEQPDPVPGLGEVVVKLHASSLNFRDLMVVEGTYNPRMKLPAIPFSDGAGEVVSVGGGVTKWQAGDRVMPIFAQLWMDGDPNAEIRRSSLGAGRPWDGTLREYAVFNENGLVAIPTFLDYGQAATLPCAALTAWHALIKSGGIKPGDTVVTLGTGGVSIFALQFARMAGARVIATSSSDQKLARLKELGADETINYRESEDWDKAVLELTSGRGADHVVEVGGADTLPRSINATRFGGHIAMIGALTGAASFNPTSVFMKAVRVQGIYVGNRRMFEEMVQAIEVNGSKPVIDTVFGFDDVAAALNHLKQGSHFGKIVIDYSKGGLQ